MNRRAKSQLVLIFVVSILASIPLHAEQLRAGAAKVSLNPPAGISLAGFGGGDRRHLSLKKQNPYAHRMTASTGTHDDVFVKTTLLQFGSEKLLIIGLDLVASSADLRRDLASRVSVLGIEEKNIILSATHTHSGPGDISHAQVWQLLAADIFVPEVYQTFLQSIEQSVRMAEAQLQPAVLAIDQFHLENAILNRRKLPELDPVGTLIRVDALNGAPISTVLNFPIHGTVLGTKNLLISADIPGAIAHALEKRTGGIVVYVNGAEGDVSPIVPSSDFAGLEIAGNTLAESIFSNWKTLRPHAPQRFALVEKSLGLGTPKLNVYACLEKNDKSAKWLLPLKGLGLPKTTKMEVFHIDDHLFITVPGEPITRIGLMMKEMGAASGYKSTSIFGLTNDHLGYILTEDEYRRGMYESCGSLYGPHLGTQVLQEARSLIQALSQN